MWDINRPAIVTTLILSLCAALVFFRQKLAHNLTVSSIGLIQRNEVAYGNRFLMNEPWWKNHPTWKAKQSSHMDQDIQKHHPKNNPQEPRSPPSTPGLLEAQLQMLDQSQLRIVREIMEGRKTKGDIEIVLAVYGDDLQWCEMYAAITTVYQKKDHGTTSSRNFHEVNLPNVGRETHTYLYHIVNNYDRLAEVTVFGQGNPPLNGYHGHMFCGVTFHDYVTSPTGLFIFTEALAIRSMKHTPRANYYTPKCDSNVRQNIPDRCFEPFHGRRLVEQDMPDEEIHNRIALFNNSEDQIDSRQVLENSRFLKDEPWWKKHRGGGLDGLLAHINKRCEEEKAPVCTAQDFWRRYIKLPLHSNAIVWYAQGAIFSATRAQIRRRPLADYQALLEAASGHEDSSVGYFMEFFWNVLITHEAQACDQNTPGAHELAFSPKKRPGPPR